MGAVPAGWTKHGNAAVAADQAARGAHSLKISAANNGERRIYAGGTVGKHQFFYNVQPSGSEFGKGSAYNYTFDGNWHCAEWHIDKPTQSYHFYYDNVEVSVAISNGAGNYNGSDILSVFSQVHVGWNNYQSAPPGFVAWIDEVAMDVNRIGCGN